MTQILKSDVMSVGIKMSVICFLCFNMLFLLSSCNCFFFFFFVFKCFICKINDCKAYLNWSFGQDGSGFKINIILIIIDYYRLHRKWKEVMFSPLSVCLLLAKSKICKYVGWSGLLFCLFVCLNVNRL